MIVLKDLPTPQTVERFHGINEVMIRLRWNDLDASDVSRYLELRTTQISTQITCAHMTIDCFKPETVKDWIKKSCDQLKGFQRDALLPLTTPLED
jgi:hypothetical protein